MLIYAYSIRFVSRPTMWHVNRPMQRALLRKRTIVHVVFNMRDVDKMLEHIQSIIDEILQARKVWQ